MSFMAVAGEQSKTNPVLVLIQGTEQKNIIVDKFPFTIGRKTENCLVLAEPSVSREHASLVFENGEYFIVDQGSKHGTFVNSQRVERQQLRANDRVQFGGNVENYAIFSPSAEAPRSDFLSHISTWKPKGKTSDLEQLTLFLEVARQLTSSNVLEDVLATLVEATIRLTGAERGYIFLLQPDKSLKLACGRSSKGQVLTDESTLSHSVLRDAVEGKNEFLVTDTTSHEGMSARQSIVAHNLRSIICIPLRARYITDRVVPEGKPNEQSAIRGVLYLDSRYLANDLTGVSHDILTAIANDAAAVVENAYLVQAEEKARRYQQELNIAARIQQRLLTVKIPDCPYAKIDAKNIACKDVGGDFFDVVPTDDGLYFVVADVCGKGITAALLASILQGMTYSNFVQKTPLEQIVKSANSFLCEKQLEEKYATLVIARVTPAGILEIVNCGHVPPLLVRGGKVIEIENGNMPVGLFDFATYTGAKIPIQPGDRLVIVSDGVTEAEAADGEFFGVDRLKEAALQPTKDTILTSVLRYAGDVPLNDDCSIFELTYTGGSA
jgi:sigma-B regulation protein RsbU (phosphoserine phosphatase)